MAIDLLAETRGIFNSPTMTEQMEQAKQQPFTVPQATIDFYAAMTPQERAEYGFEGDDWEDQLRRSFNPR